jgi:hypothetical protein
MDIKVVDCKYKLSLLNNKNDCIKLLWMWSQQKHISLKQFIILFNHIQEYYPN